MEERGVTEERWEEVRDLVNMLQTRLGVDVVVRVELRVPGEQYKPGRDFIFERSVESGARSEVACDS